jgi:hypothetical protein
VTIAGGWCWFIKENGENVFQIECKTETIGKRKGLKWSL